MSQALPTRVRFAPIALLLALLPFAAACSSNGSSTTPAAQASAQRSAVAGVQAPSSSSSSAPLRGVADIVQKVAPSVVRVGVECSSPDAEECAGTGSGWVLDNDGHIVTNNHVVTLAGQVRSPRNVVVTLLDGRHMTATVAGTDPRTDLAVLKVDNLGLDPLELSSLSEVHIGDPAVAIGYALDLGSSPSVTTGVVSAREREIREETTSILGTIQTDAAINPGNSGGPLLDGSGRVIGVNTAGIQGAEGIGFAVSVDTVKKVTSEILKNGSVRRGFIGIAFRDMTAAMAKDAGLPVNGGVRIEQVVAGSPADSAGLKEGDVIVSFAGEDVRVSSDVALALVGRGPGTDVAITYYRGTEKHDAKLKLAAPPSNP